MFKPEYNEESFPHWHRISVRFRDLDPLNHVNNALFNTYLEEARINFLGAVGGMKEEFAEGKSFVLVKITVEYIGQITYPSDILIGTAIGEVGNTSVEALQAVYDADSKKLLATGRSRGVWFDIRNQRPTRLPDIDDIDSLIWKG